MGNVARQPAGYVALLSAIDYLNVPSVEITLVGDRRMKNTFDMRSAIGRRFIPELALRQATDSGEFPSINGRTTAYVCAAGACRAPVVELEELETLLDEIER